MHYWNSNVAIKMTSLEKKENISMTDWYLLDF